MTFSKRRRKEDSICACGTYCWQSHFAPGLCSARNCTFSPPSPVLWCCGIVRWKTMVRQRGRNKGTRRESVWQRCCLLLPPHIWDKSFLALWTSQLILNYWSRRQGYKTSDLKKTKQNTRIQQMNKDMTALMGWITKSIYNTIYSYITIFLVTRDNLDILQQVIMRHKSNLK